MAKFTDKKKGNSIDWLVDTAGFEWLSYKNMPTGVSYHVLGAFILPDKGYGKSPVLILCDEHGVGCFTYLPNRYTDEVESVLADPAGVEEIKDGLVMVTFNEYTIKKGPRAGQICINADFTNK